MHVTCCEVRCKVHDTCSHGRVQVNVELLKVNAKKITMDEDRLCYISRKPIRYVG